MLTVEEAQGQMNQEREMYKATIDRLRGHLGHVLPMAKGYAAAHAVGRNAEIVREADRALAVDAGGGE